MFPKHAVALAKSDCSTMPAEGGIPQNESQNHETIAETHAGTHTCVMATLVAF